MFNFDNANIYIDKQEILKHITELQIFERYCSNFKDLNSKFKSEFYNDRNPSCKIIISLSGIPYYRDYGNGDYFSSFEYVSKKYYCNYYETCNIIANDFNITKNNIKLPPQILLGVNDSKLKLEKPKLDLQVFVKPFNIIDYNYWNSYNISFEILNKFNVKACNYVYLTKEDNHYLFEYKKDKPLYSYRFFKDNNEYYKIYNPFSDKKEGKWLGNVPNTCLQGYDQLVESGELLFITKSLKDVMSLYSIGYNSVALQAESNILSKKSFKELSSRFKRIILLLDNDNEGRNSTARHLLEYRDLEFYFIEQSKDISDFIKEFGVKKAEKLIKSKLK